MWSGYFPFLTASGHFQSQTPHGTGGVSAPGVCFTVAPPTLRGRSAVLVMTGPSHRPHRALGDPSRSASVLRFWPALATPNTHLPCDICKSKPQTPECPEIIVDRAQINAGEETAGHSLGLPPNKPTTQLMLGINSLSSQEREGLLVSWNPASDCIRKPRPREDKGV